MQGMILENCKYVPAFVPIDTTGAAQSGDWIILKGWRRVLCVVQQGAWAGGTPALTFEQATTVAGGSSKALSYTKKWEGVALTDDTLASATVTSDTSNLPAVANSFTAVEFHAQDLDHANGFDCLRMLVASPGANADLITGFYLLADPYFASGPATHISAIA